MALLNNTKHNLCVNGFVIQNLGMDDLIKYNLCKNLRIVQFTKI